LNEVGGNPDPEKVSSRESFYEFIRERQTRWPDTLNATSTHDTKRSEDVRARLNALSEIPDEWISKASEWSRQNDRCKQIVAGRKVPDANEEYLIYQTLLGLWPNDRGELPAICERLQAYIVKAIREAMLHTRWTEPNVPHEAAIGDFIGKILLQETSREFISDVAHFHEKIGYAGMLNALGQALLKIACPGVPDFYQGSELWDYHLVDPDNRNPVDFETRRRVLEDVARRARTDTDRLAKELWASWPDGNIKLYVIWKALNFRRTNPGLFREGEFLPCEIIGAYSEKFIAFCRRRGNDQVICVIPRWSLSFPRDSGGTPRRMEVNRSSDTYLVLPREPMEALRNVFTTSSVKIATIDGKRCVPVGELISDFPVAMLAGTDFS
jgi:(1->4)-alpha-D-glucan 1-alpha-D-glucosylmutase